MRKLFIIVFVCTLFSCEKTELSAITEESKLPAITEEGKNTLGMLVDGFAWKPHKPFGFISSLSAYYDNRSAALTIEAYNTRQNRNEQLFFYFHNVTDSGDYKFAYGAPEISKPDSVMNCSFRTVFEKYGNSGNCEDAFILRDQAESCLHLTKLDTANRIVSGTFSVKLSNASRGVLEITKGRFDINY